MRTPALCSADRQISDMNTYFSCTSFIVSQFWIDHKSDLVHKKSNKTADMFSENSTSCRINVSLEKLQQLTGEHEFHTMELCVSKVNEAVKEYFDWINQFLDKMGCKAVVASDELTFFQQIETRLSRQKYEIISKELEWTFDHIRARRNCLVHRNGDANAAFLEVARQHGDALNKFWEGKLKAIASKRKKQLVDRYLHLDFQTRSPLKIDQASFLDLLRVARLSLEIVDQQFCKFLSPEWVATFCKSEFEKNCEPGPESTRLRRFHSFCELLFAWKPDTKYL